jgi:hypothetical protein
VPLVKPQVSDSLRKSGGPPKPTKGAFGNVHNVPERPPERGRPRIAVPKPESGDAADVRRHFGIKESLLYDLDKRGLVESVVIPGRGKSGRGKRLYKFASIRRLLAAQQKGVSAI